MTNIPKSLKDSILGEDYQRISNDLADKGYECKWDNDGAYSIHNGQRIDMNVAFMYPHTLNLKRKHFKNIIMIEE